MFRQHYDFSFKSMEMGREEKGEESETKFSVYAFVPSYWNIQGGLYSPLSCLQ